MTGQRTKKVIDKFDFENDDCIDRRIYQKLTGLPYDDTEKDKWRDYTDSDEDEDEDTDRVSSWRRRSVRRR